jgi:hypothetical protein
LRRHHENLIGLFALRTPACIPFRLRAFTHSNAYADCNGVTNRHASANRNTYPNFYRDCNGNRRDSLSQY